MYGRNDDSGGNKWVPTERFERIDVSKYRLPQQRESDKPNTQLGSSSATSAGSSKGKEKSK